MNVDGVFARRKTLDVQRDFDAFWSAGKLRGAHTLAVGIFEIDCHCFGSRATVRILGLDR
jgi:hypothetical protein